jgi:hypothetical protein
MYLFQLFRSFLPLHNPIGFGVGDFVELALASSLILLVLARAWLEPAAVRLSRNAVWSMLFLFVLVVVLRLALLPANPVPTAAGSEDFSRLLLGDTLAHFRLANPPHPMGRFFETKFVAQEPSYSSIYPIGEGMVLAFGQLCFSVPWAGALLAMAVFCGLCYWMLRGWVPPGWALAAGLLAVCEFGPLSTWMNSYSGGAFSAIAGCLVFGALPRLRERRRNRDAVLLGLGLGAQLLSRPYESLLLDLSVVLFFVPELLRPKEWPRLANIATIAALSTMPAVALVFLHNRAVTGSWATFPYSIAGNRFGLPAPGPYRFFLLAPLCLALPFFLPRLREFRFAWIALTLLVFAFGSHLDSDSATPAVAAVASLFVLACVLGLIRLNGWQIRGWQAGQTAARWILFLCGAHFLFWYGIHALGDEGIRRAMAPFETAAGIGFGDADGRIAISRRLAQTPGRQLVFVRYFLELHSREWVHNAADIDSAPVVWALDLGVAENAKLQSYYPNRTVWLMEPDALPPRLAPYRAIFANPFEPVE